MAFSSDMMFQVDISHMNRGRVAAKLATLEKEIDGLLVQMTYEAVEIFEDELKKEIDNQDLIDTGRMKGSIHSMVREALNGFWDNVGTTKVVPYYAYYLEFGTVNHQAYKFARIAFSKAYPKIVNLFYTQASAVLEANQLFGSGW